MKDVISIIVPVYNVATSLQKCLNSILCQTYTNLEIILVEDGSTDSSGAICDAYASKDSRIKVIHKKNSGLVEARKTGICAAQGEYVGYVDGDDWIESDMYETLLACMTKYHVDMVESDHWMDVDTQFSKSKSKLGYGRFDVDGIRTGMILMNAGYALIYGQNYFGVVFLNHIKCELISVFAVGRISLSHIHI